jgi:hypothetical protein
MIHKYHVFYNLFLLNTPLNRQVVFQVLIHVVLTSQLNTGISYFDKLGSQDTHAKTHRPC